MSKPRNIKPEELRHAWSGGSKTTVLGWHFLRHTRRLGYGDGREARTGETLRMFGKYKPSICKRGMHASPTVRAALRCAEAIFTLSDDAWLCRVVVSGEVTNTSLEGWHADNKFVGRRRRVLWMARWGSKQLDDSKGYILPEESLRRLADRRIRENAKRKARR